MSAIPLWAWSDLSLLLLMLLIHLLVLTLKRTSTSSKSQLPPCPPKLPLIGNLHQLGLLPHQSLHALADKYGPLMLLKLGQIPTLVVSSAETAQEIMKTHDHIFASRPFLLTAHILANGGKGVTFVPYGEHWRQMRKLCVSRLLSTKMVQSFHLTREEEVASMVTNIYKACISSDELNMSEILNVLTSKVLLKAISGKFFREEGRSDYIIKLIEENSAILGKFSISDILPSFAWLDVIFGVRTRVRLNAKRWNDVLEEIIEGHENMSKEQGDAHNSEETTDFVSILLALQKDNMEFSVDRGIIKAVLQNMIAAGTETSFVVLDWCMAELVRNSETLEKLQHEVRGVAKFGSMVRHEDLIKMSYLNAVIKEVLRLHPPVPLLVPRESMDQCMVQGFNVPKRTRVLVNAWSICRDAKVWEAPRKFCPERFLDSPFDFRGQDFEFIPFGAGRRICPGMQFAISTIELALANLVHLFDWKLPDGMKSEDLDMGDSPGLATRRRQSLHLVAKPFFVQKVV